MYLNHDAKGLILSLSDAADGPQHTQIIVLSVLYLCITLIIHSARLQKGVCADDNVLLYSWTCKLDTMVRFANVFRCRYHLDLEHKLVNIASSLSLLPRCT